MHRIGEDVGRDALSTSCNYFLNFIMRLKANFLGYILTRYFTVVLPSEAGRSSASWI